MKLEGKNAIFEALNSDIKIKELLILINNDDFTTKIINLAKQKGVKIIPATKQVLDKESVTGRHQGMIGYIEEFKYVGVEDILKRAKSLGQDPFIIVLDKIEDPHNLGSIIRTAEGAGVHGIILPKNRACRVNETVVRTSAGSVQHMLVAMVTNLNSTINSLKKENIFFYALEAGGTLIYDAPLKGAIALVIGSEGLGVSALTKKTCDGVLQIPMFGKINSLNASVAAGIAMYEAVKQRNF